MRQSTLFPTNRCSITTEGGSLVIKTPYDQNIVALMKSLPRSDRQWDAQRKVWLVDPRHSATVSSWIKIIWGEDITLPTTKSAISIKEVRSIEALYIGKAKAFQGEDERLAFAMDMQSETWEWVIPERALREWFDGSATPNQITTLYGVLGIQRGASLSEIKFAFRRMAKQWHPDVCHEPGAQETYLRIQEAYQILSDEGKRERYDAGLMMESLIPVKIKELSLDLDGYRSPLRCGIILAEGRKKLNQFYVDNILAWADIINLSGQTLVVSWPYGQKSPTRSWM